MAHGNLSATDVRGQSSLVGDIASAIGNRIGKSSNMARKERAFASKKAEEGGTSLEEAGIGRGYFFKRALGSSFGGDRVAKTRGRFESDPGPGRDPTGSQSSRFRGGFDYGVTNEVKSSPGGVLANISKGISNSGGASGGVAGFLESGAQAINPEVLGGELAKSRGSGKNAAGFSTVNTTATEIKDLAGILNQIGQLIVQTSNSNIAAVTGVQKVSIKVVESVQSLGQIQVSIAERQLAQQRQLAGASEDHQEQMLSRQLAAAEAKEFTEDDFSGQITAEKPGKRQMLGGLLGGGANLLGDGLDFMSGRDMNRGYGRPRQRGARRRLARRRLGGARRGISRGMGAAGGALTGLGGVAIGKGLKKTGVTIAGKGLAKGVGKGLGKAALKKIPGVGLIAGLGFGVERLMRGDVLGAGLELASGAASTVPGVGTLGSIGIDAALAGRDMGVTPFERGGIIDSPTLSLMGEGNKKEGVFPLEGREGKKTFLAFGEGMLEAQKRDRKNYAKLQAEGLSEYFDKKGGWLNFKNMFNLPDLPDLPGGGGGLTYFDLVFDPIRRALASSPYTGPITGDTFNPVAAPRREAGNVSKGQNFNASRDGGARTHAGIDVTDAYSMGNNDVPVIAYKTGTVISTSPTGGGPGGVMSVDHGDGLITKYYHVNPRSGIKKGDTVYGGQHIADLHKYSNAAGVEQTHLHFEVEKDGTTVDPTRYYNEAKNKISSPMTDTAAQAKSITPKAEPVVTPEPGSETEKEKQVRIDNQLKNIAKLRESLSAGSVNRKMRESFKDKSRSSKPEEAVIVDGVGKIQYHAGVFGGKHTYWDENGNQIKTLEEFNNLRIEQDKKLQKQQIKLMNERPDLLSSAVTTPDVLQTSAVVNANERHMLTKAVVVSVPTPSTAGGKTGGDTVLAHSGAASGDITPSWLLNRVAT
jgi:murein DD-endopeptidase MepM/ murein hydrolase activator NlpD